MKFSRKWTLVVIIILAVVTAGYFFLNRFNGFKKQGELALNGLEQKVMVARDEKGMAHIRAESFEDLIFAQGFVTAQDRYFSMEMIRRVARGQLSEVLGEAYKQTDIKMRTIGFYRNAKAHARLLDPREKALFSKYVDGVNAFISQTPADLHLKLRLMGISPEKWEIADVLGIIYYMGWGSSANLSDEIVAQMLVEKLGPDRARQLFPLNFNPDEPDGRPLRSFVTEVLHLGDSTQNLAALTATGIETGLGLGSNNWVTSGALSQSGGPVLANDPHLKTRTIPGPFYPIGLAAPGIKSVGVNVPGIPGLIVGRTGFIAAGVTNGYADIQDLYLETLDPKKPEHYLEGSESIPFMTIKETLKIKDKDATGGFRHEDFTIRLTRRGPVISTALKELDSPHLFTLRWSPFESMGSRMGFFDLLRSKDIHEARKALSLVNAIMLNFVLADTKGNIAWQTVGRVPIRSQKDSTLPYAVKDSQDNWTGFIPWEEMPRRINPSSGWVGTCNHTTVTNDYPYYFSSHFSPSWRQRRLIELMSGPGKKSVQDHWEFQRDTKNLMARRIVPVMSAALQTDPETLPLADILSGWNFSDKKNLVAPTVFHQIFREFYFLTYQDELGESLSMLMGKNYYFWQERLVEMMEKGESSWFDDTSTSGKKEILEDLLVKAGVRADEKLKARLGEDRNQWIWGKVHVKEFLSPVRQKGFGKDLVGSGPLAMDGSVETLYRAYYDFDSPYTADVTAALRMVVDLNDLEKVQAVLPCGVSDRLFNPHRTDQIKPFMDGTRVYWWFSDDMIEQHTRTMLYLLPGS